MGRLPVASLVCLLGLAACASHAASTHPAVRASPASGRVPLEAAIRDGRDLGPLPPAQTITFALTLAYRDPSGLTAVLSSGSRVTPATFDARYGPDPARVDAAMRVLAGAGLTATWKPGDIILTVSGQARAVEHFLGVGIHGYIASDGSRFHAGLTLPDIPASLRGTVIAITGLNDYQRGLTSALPPADVAGVTPQDMEKFYDVTPLRSAGLDGSGQTVVFIEWGMPPQGVLSAYAHKFTPNVPFNVTVHQDAADWGAPLRSGDKQYAAVAGEAALDLEIVHAVAPGAHEVVYEFGDSGAIPAVINAIAMQSPTAILSSSISEHACEQERDAASDGAAENQIDVAASAQGMSILWASGDRGAYMCLSNFPDQDPKATGEISVMPDASSAGVTAVGGTTAFLGTSSAYFEESSWGEPIEQWGSGGGTSTLIPRPSWQQAPGVPAAMNGRGLPDVAANADIISGWDIIAPDPGNPNQIEEGPVGGTSAAAPFWAAIIALIDEDLAHKSLPPVGFANPALYLFAQAPSGLPAPAFHDVTLGSNLHYPAGPGWDMATGLGTPNVGALANDFEWFERTHGSGG
jgi:kumamolisin